MDSVLLYVALGFVILLIAAVVVVARRRGGGSGRAVETKPRPGIDYAPGVGDDDSVPRDTPRRTVDVIEVGEPLADTTAVAAAGARGGGAHRRGPRGVFSRSRFPSRQPGGSSGCAPGSPVRTTRWAAGSSRC